MKKVYTLITLLLSIFLVACNNNPLPDDFDISVKFDLTYKLDDDSIYQVYKVRLGDALPIPSEPTKEGYNFDGWYVGDEKFEGTVVEASTLTLVARFSPKLGTIVTHNVSFYDDDTLLQTISVEHGEQVETEPNTNKEGKNFIGWFIDIDLTIQFSLDNKINEDTILFGKWSTIQYDVLFYRGNNIYSAVTVNGGTTIPEVDTTVTGYQFVGWYTDSMLTQAYNDSTPITSDLTLYGKWSALTYSVTYYDGNSVLATRNVEHGNTAPSINTTKNGYSFVGWYTNSLLTTPYNSAPITSNTSLYGKWQQNTDPNPQPGDYTGYYKNLNGLSGSQLNTVLDNLIKSTGSQAGSTNQVKSVDSWQGSYYLIYDGIGSYGNREHVTPATFLRGVNKPEDDLHNLRAAKVSTNSTRSSYPFGDFKSSGGWQLQNGKFYPGKEFVGDVARIVLYITLRNGININNIGNLNMFLKWHLEDPVNEFETTRNNRIYAIQNNRNPFIDHPELVTLRWGQPNSKAYTVFEYRDPSLSFAFIQ